jgi:prophage tail gpP-like protein
MDVDIMDAERCEQRAQRELTSRAARGARVEVTGAGWRQADGVVWPLGARTLLDSPSLGIRGERAISGVTHTIGNDGGTITRLRLDRAGAFEPDPSLPPQRS